MHGLIGWKHGGHQPKARRRRAILAPLQRGLFPFSRTTGHPPYGRCFTRRNLNNPSSAGHLAPRREGIMKTIHWIIAVAGIALGLPTQAEAAQIDPEVIIYRFPGVQDDGGAV